MAFPVHRPRRLRASPAIRQMVAETALRPDDFIYPLFVQPGRDDEEPIEALPGQFRRTPERTAAYTDEVVARGIPAVLLFGKASRKDDEGSEGWDPNGAVQQAAARIRDRHPDLLVVTDVCLDAYTTHGHCGLVRDGRIDNDPSLERLARIAVSHARAGAQVVAPSDMMDGRVGAIRGALDAAGLSETAILAYSAKYASAFYGPFREATGGAPKWGDRTTYQMDPRNGREAEWEARLDVEEGADMIMVKPALGYLDVIARLRQAFTQPLVAYNVSGEYSMLHAAAERGWLDLRRAALEVLTGIRRAGADLIITYHALEAAEWLAEADGRAGQGPAGGSRGVTT